MGLADDLAAEYTADEPSEYRPRIEFDGGNGTFDTGVIKGEIPQDFSPLFQQCLEAAGYSPDQVKLGKPLRESHWQQKSRDNDEPIWLHAYKFEAVPPNSTIIDLEAIVKAAKKKEPAAGSSGHWFVYQGGDQQIGKRSRDGSTEEIVERYCDSVELAKKYFKKLKPEGIEGIQISLPGDCIEGGVSQGGKNLWLTRETIVEQTRVLRRLMMFTVETLAPLVDQVFLDVVGGNHDEAARDQNFYPGNNWATESAIAVGDALKMNEAAYGHVQVRIPEKWSGMMTVPVGDSVVTVVHGHQWRKHGAMQWWADQAVNNHPAGGSQILQHGHWHQFQLGSNKHRTVIGSPTFDMGSDWLRQKNGATAKQGALVYLLTGGEISHLSLV
jgi:hypothetical protein